MSVSPPPTYPAAIEQAIAAISEHLRGDYPLSRAHACLAAATRRPRNLGRGAGAGDARRVASDSHHQRATGTRGRDAAGMANRTPPPAVEPATRGAGDASDRPTAPQHPRRVGRLAVHESVDRLPHPRAGAVLRVVPVRGRVRRGHSRRTHRREPVRRVHQPVRRARRAGGSALAADSGTVSWASTACGRWA
jgi:hypothetical protein